MSANSLFARIIIAAENRSQAALDSVRTGFSSIGESISSAKNLLIGFFAVGKLKEAGSEVIDLADRYTQLSNKLRLAADTSAEYRDSQTALFDIAQRTKTDLEAIALLYARTEDAVKKLGGSQADAYDLTESLAQGFKISGASAADTASIIRQLSQAMQSGVLRGDEFNSVMENGPRVAKALADGLGVPTGALRKMAEQGQLTSDLVLKALLSQKDAIASEYAKLDSTVSGTLTQIKNRFFAYVGATNEATGATKKLIEAINYVTGAADSAGGSLSKTITDLVRHASDLSAVEALGKLFHQVFEGAKAGADYLLAAFKVLYAHLSDSAALENFGTALNIAFDVAAKLADEFLGLLRHIFTIFSDTTTPTTFGTVLSTVFEKLAANAGIVLNTLSNVINTTRIGFYGLAGVIAEVISAALSGVNKLQTALSQVTFGNLSAQFSAAAEQSKAIAEAFAASAEVNFGKAGKALDETVVSSMALRESYALLAGSSDAVNTSVEATNTTLAATAEVSGLTADQLDALGEGAQVAAGKLVLVKDEAAKTGIALKTSADGAAVLAAAYKTLKVKSSDELNKLALEAATAFAKIRYSGEATAVDITNAFQSYAEKAVAANHGVISEVVKNIAATNNLSISTDAAGKVIVTSFAAGAQTAEQLAASIRNAAAAATQLAAAEQQRANARQQNLQNQIGAEEQAIQSTVDAQAQADQQRAESSGGFSQWLAAQITNIKANLNEFGTAWAETWQKNVQYVYDWESLFTWLGTRSERALYVAKEYNATIANSVHAFDAMAGGAKHTTDELQKFIAAGENSLKHADMLSKITLDKLTQAIAGARQELQGLAQEAESARGQLTSLQDEYDQLNGNKKAIEERQYALARQKLEAQIANAQSTHNQAESAFLKQSLTLLNAIHLKKTAIIQKEAADQAIAEAKTKLVNAANPPAQATHLSLVANNSAAPTTGATQPVSTQPTHIIQIRSPDGSRVANVSAGVNDAKNLLSILEQFKQTS
jgi:tape measure domain-containing protein